MFHFIFKEREKQLKTQKKIDKHLIEMKNECPLLVAKYLLQQRDITRNQQFTLINSDLFSLTKNLKKEMDVHHHIHISFEDKIKEDMSIFQKCKNLKFLLD
jgi:hypothetical protein